MSKSKPELKLVEDTGSQLQAAELGAELPPQQSEMPFAVVEGEPMTELPRDLYIPPDALQVFLEAFEGPLDLLLYLIRKQNLDILDIPIAEITRQYMKYIEVMADLQLELAGEYLLMAAMLAEIKSRMLLPRPAAAEGHEEEDPRAELVRRLQEYERFKKAAEDLDQLSRLERDTMPASAEMQERKVVKLQPEVTLKEMLLAFRDVLSRADKFAHHHITRERLSQRERMSEILSRLQTAAFFEFTQLFRPEEGRMGVTVTFIAILELMKEGLIEIVQAEAYAPIHVRTAQRHLKVVAGGAASADVDAENEAALAQPELEGENDIEVEDEEPPPADEAAQAEAAAVEGALAEAEAVAVALGVDEVVIGEQAAPEPVAADAEQQAVPEPVAVEDTEHQAPPDGSVEEMAEQAPVIVAFDAAAEEAPEAPADDLTAEAPAQIADEIHGEVATEVAADTETSPFEEQALAQPESDEQVAVVLEPEREAFATTESDDAATAPEPEALAASESEQQAAIVSEPEREAFAAPEFDEPAAVPEPQVLVDEQVTVVSEPDPETFEPAAASEPPVASSEPVAESADSGFVADQETSDDAQASVILQSEADEGAVVALETVVEEHVIEEHVIPEHVVEENVVEENVVPERVIAGDAVENQPVPEAVDSPAPEALESNEPPSAQRDELSVSDDSVTESSSEADNSDAEPSR